MPKEITEEDLKAIQRSFEVLDKDNNGRISDVELMKGVQVLGFNPTLAEARDLIEEVDTSGNGHIEYSEYEVMMRKKLVDMDREEELMRDAFRKFDKNGDGTISARELRTVFCRGGKDSLTKEDVDELFKEADVDCDGVINYEEFVKAFCQS